MARLDQLRPSEPPIGSAEDYRSIEAVLGIYEPNHDFRNRIASYVSLYDKRLDGPNVRPGQLKKWLERIEKDASALRADLDIASAADDEDESPLAWARMDAVQWLLPRRERETLIKELSKLIAKTKDGLASLPVDKGGPPTDWHLYGLICALATAYEIETGKQPRITYDPIENEYDSQFYRFVEKIFNLLVPQYSEKSHIALGKSVDRGLRIWRRQRGAS